ncbi:MAG: response regulator [Rhodospirillales bacterium]
MNERVAPTGYADLTVAVIDDDELITQLVERILERMGIGNVYRVTRSHRFIDMIAEGIGGMHLIICDIGMPHVDGHAILRAVREADADVPFIMLTADQSDEAVTRAIAGGVSAYVVKPIDPAALSERIAAVLERAYGIKR